jgi:hypothetical protein
MIINIGMWWPGLIIGLYTQWWVRTRKPRWYNKYNCAYFGQRYYDELTVDNCVDLTSAALDGGSSIIYFILNFAVFGESSVRKLAPLY